MCMRPAAPAARPPAQSPSLPAARAQASWKNPHASDRGLRKHHFLARSVRYTGWVCPLLRLSLAGEQAVGSPSPLLCRRPEQTCGWSSWEGGSWEPQAGLSAFSLSIFPSPCCSEEPSPGNVDATRARLHSVRISGGGAPAVAFFFLRLPGRPHCQVSLENTGPALPLSKEGWP